MRFKPIWFDSMGAKSSCCLVETPNVKVLIDPGIAVMQPSFPASIAKKVYWQEQGRKAIKKAANGADIVVISHYHYDHYFPDDLSIYKNKVLLVKNPNEWINDSQRQRAFDFFSNICKVFGKEDLEDFLENKKNKKYDDLIDDLRVAKNKDFGDYNKRRKQLLAKGKRWFLARVKKWNSYKIIPELDFKNVKVKFAEGKEFKFGKTKLRFTKPLFHGLEYSRVGFIFATVIESSGKKFIHTSDMDGPIIEDYADWIIKENPDILVLDGPMTYMFGYLLNKTNLNRAVDNITKIVKRVKAKTIIYDHHLTREKLFKDRTDKVWKDKRVKTAAEYLGKKTKVLEL